MLLPAYSQWQTAQPQRTSTGTDEHREGVEESSSDEDCLPPIEESEDEMGELRIVCNSPITEL